MSQCAMSDACSVPASYILKSEVIDEPFLLCAEHTAEVRANDPLDYIESVRSLRPSEVPS